MDGHRFYHLLHLLFFFQPNLCIHVNALHPSCDPVVSVKRGTVWKAVPHQRLRISCNVTLCGKPSKVTWCKLVDTKCEQIQNDPNVVIKLDRDDFWEKGTSRLKFEEVSVNDDGLYKCLLRRSKTPLAVSHWINVSVSDSHRRIHIRPKHAPRVADSPNAAKAAELPWLPYAAICGGTALLVLLATLISRLCYCERKGFRTSKPANAQEVCRRRLPGLPAGTVSATRDLRQVHHGNP
ncbi:B- and T-lymphocyte attenuator-like [Lampris incognitus]|uniref:B- and T-lymphocyte attenuator-like n=1 Tax=Lampris incognitus TaxID=2546036 RepID=UPI0024B4F3F7|nr:B- and T-lymphocyte attenuator-like [Lampris incognitus]